MVDKIKSKNLFSFLSFVCAFDFKIAQVSLGLQQFAQKVLNSCKKATGKFVKKTAPTFKMYMLKCPGANTFHLSTY